MDSALRESPCAACGYDLRGLAADAPCPECGAAIHAAARWLTPQGRLDVGNPCLGCGYDLAGLEPSGQCPECGDAIENTLSFRLAAQSPRVLKRLRDGPIWIFAGMGAQLIVGFASSLLIMMAIGVWQQSRAAAVALGLGGVVIAIATQAVSFIGYWKLSTPLSGPVPTEWNYNRFRKTLRVAAVVVLVLNALGAPLALLGVSFLGAAGAMAPASGTATANPPIGSVVALGLNAGIGLLAAFAQLIRYLASAAYIRGLAERIPDASLANLAQRIYRWTAAILITAVCLVIVMGVLASFTTGSGALPGLFVLVPGVGFLVVAVIAFVLWICWIVMVAKFLAKIVKVRAAVLRGGARAKAKSP
ncbi:MAG: hypothetical protein ACTS27_10585 [Phycisphaerales bacterium]